MCFVVCLSVLLYVCLFCCMSVCFVVCLFALLYSVAVVCTSVLSVLQCCLYFSVVCTSVLSVLQCCLYFSVVCLSVVRLTTYCTLPLCDGTELTRQLPLSIPPSVKHLVGLGTFLLPGDMQDHHGNIENTRGKRTNSRGVLDVDIASQMDFIVTRNL